MAGLAAVEAVAIAGPLTTAFAADMRRQLRRPYGNGAGRPNGDWRHGCGGNRPPRLCSPLVTQPPARIDRCCLRGRRRCDRRRRGRRLNGTGRGLGRSVYRRIHGIWRRTRDGCRRARNLRASSCTRRGRRISGLGTAGTGGNMVASDARATPPTARTALSATTLRTPATTLFIQLPASYLFTTLIVGRVGPCVNWD